jgi:hypothetical protein
MEADQSLLPSWLTNRNPSEVQASTFSASQLDNQNRVVLPVATDFPGA